MPTVTLGRKRPSEAIVDSASAPKNKKIKFTDDGDTVVVPSTNNTAKDTKSSSKSATTVSKVKPDYSKFTRNDKEKREKSPQKNGPLATNTSEKHGASMGSSSLLVSDEIDFPRGGGSSFTPFEHKELRTEAIKEAESELIQVDISFISCPLDISLVISFPDQSHSLNHEQDASENISSSKKRLRNGKHKLDTFTASDNTRKKRPKGEDSDTIRAEYLNYKVNSFLSSEINV
jgi:hypothetical protein